MGVTEKQTADTVGLSTTYSGQMTSQSQTAENSIEGC